MSNFDYDAQIMQTLESKLMDFFAPRLAGKDIYYIDLPVYFNIGDVFIWKGSEIIFEQLKCNVKGRVSARNEKVLYRLDIKPTDTLVFHGGGNFGDIYDTHQSFRMRAIQAYPNNPIIIFPQSVHFSTQAALDECIAVLMAHPDLTLCVRDQVSYDKIVGAMGDRVVMMPDMAHMMHPKVGKYAGEPDNVMTLRRVDKEADGSADKNAKTFDWVDMMHWADNAYYTLCRYVFRAEQKYGRSFGAMTLWLVYANSLVKRAEKVFIPYETIDTDRLHGAIFALLLGKKVILRDNSYRKLHRYFSAWITDVPMDDNALHTQDAEAKREA